MLLNVLNIRADDNYQGNVQRTNNVANNSTPGFIEDGAKWSQKGPPAWMIERVYDFNLFLKEYNGTVLKSRNSRTLTCSKNVRPCIETRCA